MKTILFCRVSSREQEETGYSLPAQEKLLRSYAEKQNFDICKVFAISESASGKKQRETFSQMMSFIQKNNIKILVCEKVDRLTRNFKDAVMIDEWLDKDETLQVHLVKDSLVLHKNSRSQEKLNWGIRILFAKNYIDNLSEEVKKGQKEKIAQGWMPTRAPIGYKSVGEKGHKIHVVDEATAPLVKKMFESYATGNYSLSRLTDIVYQDGLRTVSGGKIVKSRIHQYLTDPFFTGKIRWNGEIYPGNQEPLIEDSLFNQVRLILKGKTTPRYSKHNYLFKSLIRCKTCMGLITWEIHKGIIYGHCNHYHQCSAYKWAVEKDVEAQLRKYFEKLEVKSVRLAEWIKKALKESHKDEITYHSASVEEISKQHNLLKSRLDRLYDDKLDGKISEEFYQQKFKQYTNELNGVDKSMARHTNVSMQYYELGINLYDISQRASLIYDKASINQKKLLIRLMFDKLILDEERLECIYSKPFQILRDAVYATNSTKLEESELKIEEKFELTEKADKSIQTGGFYLMRSNLLRS